jgi:hypothetical protein
MPDLESSPRPKVFEYAYSELRGPGADEGGDGSGQAPDVHSRGGGEVEIR